MSIPAPTVPGSRSPVRSPRPKPAARPARHPAARSNPATPPQRRARRGATPAFWFLSAALVSSLVWAVVALGALVVNTTYRMTDVQSQVGVLLERQAELDLEVAGLSSPSRIAEWADMVGLVRPAAGDSVILRVPGRPSEEARNQASGDQTAR